MIILKINVILKMVKSLNNEYYILLKKYMDFIWEVKENYISQDIDANNIGYV